MTKNNLKIINNFIKENEIKMDETGLYLIGKGDLHRLLEEQKASY